MEYEDYKDLEDGLSNLPVTWYPALIQKMVKVAYDKRVFKKGGASIFIARSVEDAILTSAIHSDGDKPGQFNVKLKTSKLPKWKSTSKF